ncbi:hypothetical protein [Nonomuraea sp. NPDC049695]|uniref:hypothetical protein n=1 Tax=Nonomuraea sp. NPDC049695 TaxID=3154734 RepID=UPI00342CA664
MRKSGPDPVDQRLGPYRNRVARLLDEGALAGYAHLEMEVWWQVEGAFWRRRWTNGRELPHWHVALRDAEGKWTYSDAVGDDVDETLRELAASQFDWYTGTYTLEWLDGVDAEAVAREHFT